MSTLTRTKICKNIRKVDLLKKAISELGLIFKEKGSRIIIPYKQTSLIFEKQTNYYVATFNNDFPELNQKLLEIEQKYDEIYKLYLDELKRKREALEREKILKNIIEQRKLEEEKAILEKEIRELEKIKKLEEKKLMQKIEETRNAIEERAKQSGFTVKRIERGNKQIIKLVRRL